MVALKGDAAEGLRCAIEQRLSIQQKRQPGHYAGACLTLVT